MTTGLVLALSVLIATPAVADTLLVYSQSGLAQPCDFGNCYFQWCLEGEAFCQATERGCTWGCATSAPVCDSPEGGSYQQHTATWNVEDGYIGWGVFATQGNVDMRDFAGDLRLFVKVQVDGTGWPAVKVEFECDPDAATYPSGVGYVTTIADHGWQTNTNWQDIAIPLVDASFPVALDLDRPTTANEFGFEIISPHRPLDDACLSAVQALSKVTLAGVDINMLSATMSVDFIRWESSNTHAGASKVTTDGRLLKVDDKPFVVNAVDYQPVGIGEVWQNAWKDRADRYDVDFPRIADMGANAVRLYAPLLTTNMLDTAWAEGLFVIPTFEVESVNLECAAGKSLMQDRFADMVNRWKDHPAILFWLIGNEVNLNLTAGVDLCTDWYPQLDSMALAAENAGSTHPVGTAVAGMTDVCTSCSDDLNLANVDLWGVQLYPGCNFGSAFANYDADPNCERPLIVTEFGVDAFHQPLAGGGSEDQGIQAACLDTLVEDAHADLAVRAGGLGVLSGQAIFEWADEWWKADCMGATSSTHDTCAAGVNLGFPDGKIHEEWFGIVALDSNDSTGRPPRTAYTTVGEKWLGPVCNMQVDAFDSGTGDTTVSFAPPAGGAVDTILYYGSLSAVSSHTYSGSLTNLGTTGSANVTLPGGDLFWVVVAENLTGEEGCYGMDSAGTERPCFSGNCDVDQVSGWNCWCSPAPSSP
jgi:hypothetical protein